LREGELLSWREVAGGREIDIVAVDEDFKRLRSRRGIRGPD